MRRRLLLVLLPLLTALLAALEVPLAQMYAAQHTQDLFIRQLGYAEYYAARAAPILLDSRELPGVESTLRGYERTVPGAKITVFANTGEPVRGVGEQHPSRTALAASTGFLVDRPPTRPRTAWPWRTEPMVVGAAVGARGPPLGAVVIEIPTTAVRDRVAARLGELAAVGLAVLLLTSALCLLPLARWILRPVHDLNATAGRLADGGLDARASERGGPPELRGLARAFNAMADALVSALQRQRAFVADASHELRNPLAALRLRVEALARNVTPDGQRDLRLALRESDRLAHVVDRLLELARAEATAAECVDVDVVALAEQRVAAWQEAVAEGGGVLRLDAPQEAMSRTAPEALEYALDVLLDNARKFARGGRIDVVVRRDGERIRLIVRDDGPGLPAEDLEHVGERFWRSPTHRATPGTGLGLATARMLLHSAGATLDVTGARDGFEVALALPAATARPLGSSAPRRGADRADTSRSPSAR